MSFGRAYGLFNSDAPFLAIRELLPHIAHRIGLPSDFTLFVEPERGTSLLSRARLRMDVDLARLAQERAPLFDYMLEASQPEVSDSIVGGRLVDLFYAVATTRQLYSNPSFFDGEVFFRTRDRYIRITGQQRR